MSPRSDTLLYARGPHYREQVRLPDVSPDYRVCPVQTVLREGALLVEVCDVSVSKKKKTQLVLYFLLNF